MSAGPLAGEVFEAALSALAHSVLFPSLQH